MFDFWPHGSAPSVSALLRSATSCVKSPGPPSAARSTSVSTSSTPQLRPSPPICAGTRARHGLGLSARRLPPPSNVTASSSPPSAADIQGGLRLLRRTRDSRRRREPRPPRHQPRPGPPLVPAHHLFHELPCCCYIEHE
jgi:hypothetical protein